MTSFVHDNEGFKGAHIEDVSIVAPRVMKPPCSRMLQLLITRLDKINAGIHVLWLIMSVVRFLLHDELNSSTNFSHVPISNIDTLTFSK